MQYSIDIILIAVLAFYDFIYFLMGTITIKGAVVWQRKAFIICTVVVAATLAMSLVSGFAIRSIVITMLLVLGGVSLIYTLFVMAMNFIMTDDMRSEIKLLNERVISVENKP